MLQLSRLIPLILLTAAVAHAEVQTKTVPYQHDGQQLEGYLAWDDSIEGERPGVLVVHEWWGLNDYARSRAEQLAEMGYVAFALDMYGKGQTTEHAEEARQWAMQARENVEKWRERAMEGLEILQSHELVEDDNIAAIGYCFGGATVLQLAYGGADLAGVVTFHGSLPVPTQEQAQQISAPLLILHGVADPFIPTDQINRFLTALEQADADYRMTLYGGAKHSFTNPAADEHGIEGIAYDRDADRRSWEHMRRFFEEIFTE